MDTSEIVRELEAERDRLNTAIDALQGSQTRRYKRRKGKMSAAARRRISQAQKARWAKARKSKD